MFPGVCQPTMYSCTVDFHCFEKERTMKEGLQGVVCNKDASRAGRLHRGRERSEPRQLRHR